MKEHKKDIKELILYAIFGVGTTIANILVYQLLLFVCDYRVSNLIAIIFTKILAYIVNKKFVFCSHCASMKELIGEAVRFIITRGFTGLIDYFGLIIMVEIFGFHKVYTKYGLQVLVIALNYVFGKKTVFVSKHRTNECKGIGEQ